MNNHYQQTYFILGTPDARRVPPDTGIEIAFAGRSNAGKSSALNVITGQRSLARISKAPGRTREINFFGVDDDRRLVDLPGYGYAKVARTVKVQWQKNIARYLETRKSLGGVILLMDVRHPLKDIDQQVLGWCHAAGLPTHVLLTKADKLKRGPANSWLTCTRTPACNFFPRLTGTGSSRSRPCWMTGWGLPRKPRDNACITPAHSCPDLSEAKSAGKTPLPAWPMPIATIHAGKKNPGKKGGSHRGFEYPVQPGPGGG
jgi:GTP-binding protein